VTKRACRAIRKATHAATVLESMAIFKQEYQIDLTVCNSPDDQFPV
jgi:hypothetical protein